MRDDNVMHKVIAETFKFNLKKEDSKKLMRQETKKKEAVTRRIGKQDNAESTRLNQTYKIEKDCDLTVDSQPFMTPGTEIAIIGFWKRDDEQSEWRCYFYFNVPNPLKREVRRSERDKGDNLASVNEK